ncbi:MAG: TIGR03668 family PPOX class F420-dependent oxidoreductase [Acidimicrobiia bacterium]
MDADQCRELFSTQPVARLGTMGPDGPHLVPVVFATDGDRVVTAVDHKPKTTSRLRRLSNVAANPSVTLLVDHYSNDWTQLWWVRADGTASIHDSGDRHATAVELLVARYEQYRDRRPTGPVIDVSVTRWRGWKAAP